MRNVFELTELTIYFEQSFMYIYAIYSNYYLFIKKRKTGLNMNAPFFFVGLFIFLIHILFDQQAISVIGIIMILYGYTEWSMYSWLYSFIWILAFVDVLIFGLKILFL